MLSNYTGVITLLVLLQTAIMPLMGEGQPLPPAKQERTLAIIKPNAVANNSIGAIIDKIEKNGLHIVALKMVYLTPSEAQSFYEAHRQRPFFKPLVEFMSSGPSVVLLLEGDRAIERYRQLMGATNPAQALPGTIRAEYADDMTANAVHGSDSPAAAERESAFFFSNKANL